MENTEKTKSFWSNGFSAKLYRRFAGKRFLKMHQKIAEYILAKKASDVLDIACGPGDFLFYLSNLAPSVHLKGTDIAPGMVGFAQRKLTERAEIFESNGEYQPFPENSFDIITIMMAFHHFPKKLEALQHIKKLLRKHGVLIIGDVIAQSAFQKKCWDFMERMMNVRGFVEHNTENDLKELAEKIGFVFSSENISGMSKRYRVCLFEKSELLD